MTASPATRAGIGRTLRARLRDGWLFIHIACFLMPLWFCISLAANPHIFAGSRLWAGLAAVASESAWSMACGACAVLGCWATFTRHPRVRFVGSAVLGTLHGYIAAKFIEAGFLLPAPGAYLIFAGMSYLSCLRLIHVD